MKANELRIRNAIWNDAKLKVKWVTHRVISDIASNNNPLPYSRISLTEEWLLKFGFEREDQHGNFKIITGKYPTWLHINLTTLEFANGYDYECSGNETKCKYVHQLQNLYFALTGEELTIQNGEK